MILTLRRKDIHKLIISIIAVCGMIISKQIRAAAHIALSRTHTPEAPTVTATSWTRPSITFPPSVDRHENKFRAEMALSSYNQKKYDEALRFLEQVSKKPFPFISRLSMIISAEKYHSENNREAAAHSLNTFFKSLNNCPDNERTETQLLKDQIDPFIVQKIYQTYITHIKTFQKTNCTKAIVDLKTISYSDPLKSTKEYQIAYAQAQYRIAIILYQFATNAEFPDRIQQASDILMGLLELEHEAAFRAQIYAALGDIYVIEAEKSRDKGQKNTLYLQAINYIEENIKILDSLSIKNSSYHMANYRIGKIHYILNNPDTSLTFFSLVPTEHPYYSLAQYFIGCLYYKKAVVAKETADESPLYTQVITHLGNAITSSNKNQALTTVESATLRALICISNFKLKKIEQFRMHKQKTDELMTQINQTHIPHELAAYNKLIEVFSLQLTQEKAADDKKIADDATAQREKNEIASKNKIYLQKKRWFIGAAVSLCAILGIVSWKLGWLQSLHKWSAKTV